MNNPDEPAGLDVQPHPVVGVSETGGQTPPSRTAFRHDPDAAADDPGESPVRTWVDASRDRAETFADVREPFPRDDSGYDSLFDDGDDPRMLQLGFTPDTPEALDLPAPSRQTETFSLAQYESVAPWWPQESSETIDDSENSQACPAWLCEDCPPHFTLRDDWDCLFPNLWDDACSVVTWENALILGVAAGAAIAIREHADGDVREYTAEFPIRWGNGSKVLREFGEFQYQLPVLFGVYGLSLWTQDEKLHEFSKAVISAYGISALATVAIKGVTDTQRPTDQFEDGHYGFPSFHASSTFAIAAVADEYYGWPLGLPCYALAGLVGWSRIDQREHDLSDVVFGSVLGFVIGKSIAGAHLERYGDYQIYPYYDPVVRGVGFTFSTTF